MALNPNYIQIRDKVEMRLPVGISVSVFDVRVQDIQPDGIYIDRPVIDKRLMPVKIGSEIELQYQRVDATYRFKTSIIREEQHGPLPILVVKHPTQLERIQRREHFRLDIEIPVRYNRIINAKSMEYSPSRSGIALDLSAGGIKFTTAAEGASEIKTGSRLQISFTLERQFSVFRIEAVVLKINPDPRREDYLELICRFINIPRNIQEAIIVHNIRYQQRYRVEKGVKVL
ncbi:MAG: hypothetical protein FJY65_06260 [Calditrichaeota bacterium]|nr:hypothetical protein [Calditrichota bacterium]